MKIFNCNLSKVNLSQFSAELTQFNRKISEFFKNYILIWPVALLYHTPKLFKNARDLTHVSGLLNPHLKQISQLGAGLLAGSHLLNKELNQLGVLVKFVSSLQEGKTAHEIAEKLSSERVKISKISSFFSDILLKSPLLNFDGDSESLQDLAVTMRLLNELIDDLASRKGMFSSGKARPAAGHIAAEARAVSVPDLGARVSPFPLGEEVRVAEAGDISLSPRPQEVTVTSIKSAFPKTFSSFRVEHQAGEAQELLDKLDYLKKSPQNIKESVIEALRFIFVDVLLGVPRFFLFELPNYIKGIQQSLEYLLSNMSDTARSIIELKELLIELDQFSSQWSKLDPIFSGLEIYLRSHEDEHIVSYDALRNMIDQLYGFVESTDTTHIITILTQFKGMIPKINPILTKALDSLNGRSLAAVAAPNPFKVRSQSGALSPLVGGGAAASGEGSAKSSSSSSEGGASGEVPFAVKKDPVKNFFMNMGQAMKEIVSAPVAGGAKPASEI